MTFARAVRLVSVALFLLAACPDATPAAPTSEPVTEVARIRFYSDELVNLHHTLYAAAWARRTAAGTRGALAGSLPAPLDAPFTAEERAAWDAAIAYYDRQLASRDMVFDDGMTPINDAIAAGDLASDAIGKELRAQLDAARPIYHRYFWPAHDKNNRAWIAATAERLKTIASDTIPRLEKLYGQPWFDTPVRADIVWVGNAQGAYTSTRPPHATIACGERPNPDWRDVEIVFHEFSHVLVRSLHLKLEAALGDRISSNRPLWHVIQFYLTGKAVQQTLQQRSIDYAPYMYSTGLFDRAWGRYKTAVETNWEPYVLGKTTIDEAIAGTVKAVTEGAAK